MEHSSLFGSMSLPLLMLLLYAAAAAVYGAALLYNKLFSKVTGRAVILPKIWYKLPFFVLLVVETVMSFILWRGFGGTRGAVYVFTGSGWSDVLGGAAKNAQLLFQIDAFGASSAALMSVVALAAGLCALAHHENIITPRKIVLFLITCLGVQGVFYVNGLYSLFAFMLLSELGMAGLCGGLFRGGQSDRIGAAPHYVARAALYTVFFCGATLLSNHYGTDNIPLLAQKIMPVGASMWAFVLLASPLFYIFIEPYRWVSDASRNILLCMKAQAALYIAFRVIFSLYGPMRGLQKLPTLFLLLGAALLVVALALSRDSAEPMRFANSTIFYMKGMILAAIGIAMSGSLSAESAALYGISATEGMISLWLIFLPVSATLVVVSAFLKQRRGDRELWEESSAVGAMPLTALAISVAVASAVGLPPFVGYSGKQLLFRSANFVSPFALTALFGFTLLAMLAGLRFLVSLTLSPAAPRRINGAGYRGEGVVALPLMLLLALFIALSAVPGEIFEGAVAPSAESLINRAAPQAALLNEAEAAKSSTDTEKSAATTTVEPATQTNAESSSVTSSDAAAKGEEKR